MVELQYVYIFWLGNLKGRGHLEDMDVGGKMTLKLILNMVGVNWIHLPQDRDKWQALVNTITNV
jgi:hypothetical protein